MDEVAVLEWFMKRFARLLAEELAPSAKTETRYYSKKSPDLPAPWRSIVAAGKEGKFRLFRPTGKALLALRSEVDAWVAQTAVEPANANCEDADDAFERGMAPKRRRCAS